MTPFAFWNDLTIAKRMQGAGALIFALVLVMAWLNWSAFQKASRSNEFAVYMQMGAMNLQLALRGLNESVFTQGASASVKSAKDGIEQFDEVYKQLLALSKDNSELQKFIVEDWKNQWDVLRSSIIKFVDESEQVDFENVQQMIQTGKLVSGAGEIADQLTIVARQAREEAKNTEKLAKKQILASAGVIVVLVIMIFISLSKSITRPVQELRRFITKVEQDSDLTSRITTASENNEVGQIACAVNSMLEKFQSILHNFSEAMKQLMNETGRLRDFSSSTSQHMGAQKSTTLNLVSATTEMVSNVQSVASSINQTAQSINEVKSKTEHNQAVVTKSGDAIKNLAMKIQQAADVVKEVNVKAESIGQVLEVIQDIADQTNLLALNAAIEAARAGEQGRGFAVVADEVRTLATRTQKSTKEIHQIIEQLQTGAEKAVQVMVQGCTQADASVGDIALAVDSLNEVTKSVLAIADLSVQISVATEQQSMAVDDISNDVTNIAKVAETTAKSADDTNNVSVAIEALVVNLEGQVGQFRVS